MGSRERATSKSTPGHEEPTSLVNGPEAAASLAGLQHAVGNQAVAQLLGPQTVQPKLRIGPPGDRFEQEADRIADTVVNERRAEVTSGTASEGVQRKCAACEEEEETLRRAPQEGSELASAPTMEQAPTTESTPAASERAAPEPQPASAPALLVDDEAAEVRAGQMRKSEFLTALRDAVCATANEGLAAAGQTTADCPWVEYWFGYAAGKDAAYVEKAIRKYAPETAGAATADAMIPSVTARVRQSVDVWATTGEMTGIPEGFADGGMGALAGVAGMFFKARPGGPRHVDDPRAVRDRLGGGRPLPAGVRSRMEAAFGAGFSHVRIHTDANAAGLSDGLNARAFTVGQHVAFGSGEYQPGSLVGDALLAHELAHVVQQGGTSADSAPMRKGPGEDTGIERDADRAAVGAVTSMWGRIGAGARQAVRPALQSGLRLSRCSKKDTPAAAVGPKKSVTVNDANLSGGTGTLASALTYANTRVYNQANVEIKKGNTSTLDEAKSKAILGDDLIVNEYSNPSSPTAEEQKLLKENQSAGAVSVYFVKGFDQGSLGESFWPSAAAGFVGFVVGNLRSDTTFSHELGHVLLDDGGHTVPDDTYLMHATAEDPTKLTPEQITKIRQSPYAT